MTYLILWRRKLSNTSLEWLTPTEPGLGSGSPISVQWSSDPQSLSLAVEVVLDQNTAHPKLLVSEDRNVWLWEALCRTVCSSQDIQHQPLCAGSDGLLLWDPPLDDVTVIIGGLGPGGDSRVSEKKGRDLPLPEGGHLGCEGHQGTVLGSHSTRNKTDPGWKSPDYRVTALLSEDFPQTSETLSSRNFKKSYSLRYQRSASVAVSAFGNLREIPGTRQPQRRWVPQSE